MTPSRPGRHACRPRSAACVWVALVLAVVPPAPGHAAPSAPDTAATVGALAAGDSAMARLELALATTAYTRARLADPASYEAAWKLARAYADSATLAPLAADQRRLCRQAETLARSAIALDPRGAKGHAFLAVALGKLAEFEGGRDKVRLSHEIKAEADTALALDPGEDLAHHVLGVWNREVAQLSGVLRFFATMLYGAVPQGSMTEALEQLRIASTLHPEVLPHHVEYGITLADADRDREAEHELELALSMPTSWVTDDHYRAKARTALAAVRRRTRASHP